jgi:AraC-like DNA-binding protein/mannose-6-phosphate isomerase-like protein (cupin superfamily)
MSINNVTEVRDGNVIKEIRTFVNSELPMTVHVDIMVNNPHHYVHKHRNVEIIMGLSGEGTVWSDMKPHSVSENKIVVINPNRIHYVTSENIFKYYCVQIDTDYLFSLGIDTDEVFFEEEVNCTELSSIISRIYNEWENENELRNVMLKSLLDTFSVMLFRSYRITDTSGGKESRTLKKVKSSISYIKSNYSRDLTLEEIASVAGLSRYHFCREFKKATDLTPIEYINRVRCERAKALLESRAYSVSEISTMCGFATSAHFSKIFKRFFLVYPSEYIKNGKIGVEELK